MSSSSGFLKFQMRTDQLEICYNKTISEGKKVICIVGCSCSTSTGAYDDLEAIGNFASKHKLWFHVDGAHGSPVIFSDKYKYLLKGIDKADSVVIDFHKMMMAPSLSTAVFLIFLGTGPVNAATLNAVPAGLRATAMAGQLFVIHVLGDMPSSKVIGMISDRTNLRLGMAVTLISFAVGAVIFFVGARMAPQLRDVEATAPA